MKPYGTSLWIILHLLCYVKTLKKEFALLDYQNAILQQPKKCSDCSSINNCNLILFITIIYGNANRKQSPTEANQNSSRSHAVLQIMVKQKDRTADVKTNVKIGKLSLIDLAGSERAAVTQVHWTKNNVSLLIHQLHRYSSQINTHTIRTVERD